MIFYVIGAGAVILFIGWLSQSDPPPKCGIYTQRNKWFPIKYRLFRFMLWLRKRQNERMKSAGENAGYGMRSRNSPEEMEKAQKLPDDHPKAVDAVYFNGGSEKGQFMVAATARRHNDVTQTILYLRLPDVGLLEIPSMPDTKLKSTDKNGFAASGLKIEPVDPMKKWKLTYTGPMRNHTTLEELQVDLDITWQALCGTYFDFDTDLHPHVMADAIAREKWSRKYFDVLKSVHQTHYEQFGEMSGVAKIQGHGLKDIKMQGVRDHSYGNIRDWRYFHRYALTYATLEDKTGICVGAISMPVTMTRLHVGYVLYPDGRKESVSSLDFELYTAGEDGNPPSEHSFKFIAGGKEYDLSYTVVDAPIFYIGEERDAKIHERMCKFKVNGQDGWGISEWAYRNVPFDDSKGSDQ